MVVGVMARAPIPGLCKTRLAKTLGDARATALYRAMLLDTLHALERTFGAERLVVLAAPEDDGVAALRAACPARWEIVPQRGDGLGARLVNAATALGPNGEWVALVSSDSPTAPWDDAARALALLREQTTQRRALMGPCDDGGYWLIALTTGELGILEGIPWST